MSAVANVLNGAADLIERDGWCQGRYLGPNGEHCVTDALLQAAGTQPGDSGAPGALVLYSDASLRLVAVVRDDRLSVWNDEFGRTQAEVVAALRAAAERASMSAPLGSNAGCYFIVIEDSQAGEWLVVGVLVAGYSWVASRWTTKVAAEASAAEYTALEAAPA